MAKYRKKPVIIDAWLWERIGNVPQAGIQPLDSDTEWRCIHCGNPAYKHGNCPTLEGWHIVCPGDFIIQGIKGEFYPIEPDIFEQTYEKVED